MLKPPKRRKRGKCGESCLTHPTYPVIARIGKANPWQSIPKGGAAASLFWIAASGADTPCLEIPSCSGLSLSWMAGVKRARLRLSPPPAHPLSTLRCRQLHPSLPEFRGVSGSCPATHSAAHSSGISLLAMTGTGVPVVSFAIARRLLKAANAMTVEHEANNYIT